MITLPEFNSGRGITIGELNDYNRKRNMDWSPRRWDLPIIFTDSKILGRSITDYTFDVMYNRIRYCEKRFPHFINRITKEEGGTITNYVGHNMCSLGGKKKIPSPPEIDEELFVYKNKKKRRG